MLERVMAFLLRPCFHDYCRRYSLARPLDLGSMQHGNEPALAILVLAGPSIGSPCAVSVALEVEDMHDAIPDRLAVVGLMHWHGLHKRSRPAVLGFHGMLKLSGGYFGH